MYRYKIDNAVTYTADDLDLFRESPFAAWMERLTFENPEHGILPDMTVALPPDTGESAQSLVETLRAQGREVAAIDEYLDEPQRRVETIAALTAGADFIVNGQLSRGQYAGRASLLMRTSGYSTLGDYLYVPCEPESGDKFNSGFKLAFLANLLEEVQGQLPPQMLIIRDGAEVVPLQTEDHIHYFLAVQERFESAMEAFRRHLMPDPSESAHFGRWSDCASEVLKQRAMRDQARTEEAAEEERQAEALAEQEQLEQAQSLQAAAGGGLAQGNAAPEARLGGTEHIGKGSGLVGHTLAERASMLQPGSFKASAAPGRAPNLARFPLNNEEEIAAEETPQDELDVPVESLQSADMQESDALQNLEFIGSTGSPISVPDPSLATEEADLSAPPTNLRELGELEPQITEPATSPEPSREPRFLPPETEGNTDGSAGQKASVPSHRLDVASASDPTTLPEGMPRVDLDSAPPPTLAPRPVESSKGSEKPRRPVLDWDSADDDLPDPFDNRLNTSRDFEDED